MRIVRSWLLECCPVDLSAEDLAELLTAKGAEVERIERPWAGLDGVVVAKVLEVRDHPNSDKLCLARVSTGSSEREVVVGVRNMAPGDLVPFAGPGARVPVLPDPLTAREIRGVVSDGMLCSPMELGIAPTHEGILLLGDDLAPGDDLKSSLGLDDAVLDIEVTPNRGDFLSVIGVAREVAAATGVPFRLPPTDVVEDDRAGGGRRDDRDRRPGSMSVLPRAHPPRCRTRPVADPCAGTADRRRDAPDLRGGRRDELRHARDRAAPSPVRPRAAEGTGDRGATGTGRREDGHARRCRANVDGRRPPDLRCRASRRGGRRHGRRARRDLRCHRADPAGSGLVRARRSPAHAPADRPLDGGLHAIRAGRRS